MRAGHNEQADCVASRRQTAHSLEQQNGRDRRPMFREECVVTSVVSDALGRVEAPGEGRAFVQRFDVTYEYPVYFTRDVFSEANAVLAEAVMRLGEMRAKIAVFVDDGVLREMPDLAKRIASYAEAYAGDIELAGAVTVVKGGEGCKNDPTLVGELQGKLVELGLDRHCYVVAVGGGAMLDVVGYVAATTHRGIRHIRIPTTVLAQNDSGVGVKNGVNAFDIKNLFGTFAPPAASLGTLDLGVFATASAAPTNPLGLNLQVGLSDPLSGPLPGVLDPLFSTGLKFNWEPDGTVFSANLSAPAASLADGLALPQLGEGEFA